MEGCKKYKLTVAAVGAWWLSNIVFASKACHYSRAAQRDEHHGFRFTAAMEWRKAAELFSFNTRAAEYCWRQWERIMHLPRWCADPIGGKQGYCW